MVPLVLMLVVLCLLFNVVVHASDSIVRDKDDESTGAGTKASKAVKMFNFASQSAGAVILDKSPATAKGYHYLLNDDKDKYGISSCHEKKWVVIGLSEDILITSVEVSNYEKYSSMLKDFQLLASNNYPTDEWINLGTYTAKPQLGSQAFNVTSESHTRYLKVKFMTHYSDEALCTLSQIKVYGMTVIASFQQEVQRSDHHTRDMLNHLTAEEDVSFREIMENSLREEANQVHEEHQEPPGVEVPAGSAAPAAEPAASSTEAVAPVSVEPGPDASLEKTADSCPAADVPRKEAEGSVVSEAANVVEKMTEGVCASDLAGEGEKDAPGTDTATKVPPVDTTSLPIDQDCVNETKTEGEDVVVTVSVEVDGGGAWVEPVRTHVEPTVSTPAEAESPTTTGPLSAQTDSPARGDSIQGGGATDAVMPLDDQCTEQTAPPQTTAAAPVPNAADLAEEKTHTTLEVSDSICANAEAGESVTEDTSDATPDAAAVKSHPFVDVVVKKLMEFNLFVNPDAAETAAEESSGKNATEQEQKQDLKNGTVSPSLAGENASSANITLSAHANTTKPANGSAADRAAHHEVNITRAVSNVSVFVNNATVVEKGHNRDGKETILHPHVENATVSSVTAHSAAAHEKNATKSSTTPHAAGESSKASGEAAPSHNASAGTHEEHKSENKSHKPVEHNTTETRPPATAVLPAAGSHNKTENGTAVPASAPVKTPNATAVLNTSHHNTTSGNGTALNCFETLSFAKFSEKMRLKLQQKSAGAGANGSHSGDSAAAAEAAALAAAAGASAKDNNVFRSLMQKIKTLEVDNAIVEMYAIQVCVMLLSSMSSLSLFVRTHVRLLNAPHHIFVLLLRKYISFFSAERLLQDCHEGADEPHPGCAERREDAPTQHRGG